MGVAVRNSRQPWVWLLCRTVEKQALEMAYHTKKRLRVLLMADVKGEVL